MKEMKKFSGVVTPLSTPMDKDGRIDFDSLENLCRYLADRGINGLLPNGTTGEVVYLSTEERKQVLKHTVKAVAGKVTIFDMVGAATTEETINLAQHAESVGADGIGVVTPYYFKLTDDELFEHYKKVADSVSRNFPVYLYAIPQNACNDITVALAERIADACPNVIGIKYSYPDMPRMLKFMDIRNHNFSVMTGPDDLFYALLASGGDGVISGNSNVIPEYYAAVYAAFQNGEYKKAAMLQDRVIKLNSILSCNNGLARYKAGLVHRGVIEHAYLRAPLRALPEDECKAMFEKLEKMDYTNPENFQA